MESERSFGQRHWDLASEITGYDGYGSEQRNTTRSVAAAIAAAERRGAEAVRTRIEADAHEADSIGDMIDAIAAIDLDALLAEEADRG